ncbi:MAG: HNH endonuclease [Acidobacteriota bacterium]
MRAKQKGVRWESDSYRQLCREILQRDGWRCQNCGSRENLQVHHKEFRSHLGQNDEQNLITLCLSCHRRVHGQSTNVESLETHRA